MSLRTPLLAGAAALGILAAGWMYVENRDLSREVARLRAIERARPDPWTGAPPPAAAAGGERAALPLPIRALAGRGAGAESPPQLDDKPKETRLERRLRRQNELAALLGRDADESEEDYRARMLPFMKMALERPRTNVEEMRKQAELAANVTEAQRQELDAAFDEVYAELIDFTNTAIADGQLTPYDRNVKGVLQYAGGLGAILEGAEGRIGKVLSPEQLRAMYDTGFEWGEYLGVRAPWEQLRPPPPRPGS
ncbi:MAG: hypothetical protein HS111_02970 [Kofleriaceae bacterium]|nr:hypothetical protein [Kofleriaceae bacterium]MCL4222856.1 hypothetical protein [Myxococcales bacterium]